MRQLILALQPQSCFEWAFELGPAGWCNVSFHKPDSDATDFLKAQRIRGGSCDSEAPTFLERPV